MTKKVYHETVTRKQQRIGENPIKHPGLLNSSINFQYFPPKYLLQKEERKENELKCKSTLLRHIAFEPHTTVR